MFKPGDMVILRKGTSVSLGPRATLKMDAGRAAMVNKVFESVPGLDTLVSVNTMIDTSLSIDLLCIETDLEKR